MHDPRRRLTYPSVALTLLALLLLVGCNDVPPGDPGTGAAEPGSEPAGPDVGAAEPGSEPAASEGGQRDGWWQPSPGLAFQWQLTGDVQPMDGIDVYDVDLFEVPAQRVAQLQATGAKVVCYMSAGGSERWRPDVGSFAAAAIGEPVEGWPGEHWLDIRHNSVRRVMTARLDLCADKGFDAVEPDLMDGYTNDTGFPLTEADQLRYARWLASEAHARGLAILQKNTAELARELVGDFDGVLIEECLMYRECAAYSPYVNNGKPAFMTEYQGTRITREAMCTEAVRLGFDALYKRYELDAWRQGC